MEYVIQIQWLVNVIVPLVLGTAIYAVFRENSFFNIANTNFQANNIITYNLPDGLWQYSLSSSIALIWKKESSKSTLLWFALVTMIGLSAEIGQYIKIFPGTFDPMDVLFISIGAILPLLLIKINYEK